ncbi:MAG: large-conductance mechanosensitive channel protein MscL [Acidobacteria bacterium]|nr:large-conductance mechanosensitive channel protein MscL [Acidobacteriota bacterium]
MWSEFKEFINRGNVMDLAIGVIIGAAFGKIVSSIVDDILMPPIGKILAGIDFKALKWVIGTKVGEDGKAAEVAIRYGNFIQTTIEFLIIAFVVFLIVRAYNRMRAAAPPPPPPPTEVLLAEIRDLLKQ